MRRPRWLPLVGLVGALPALSAGVALAATIDCAADPAVDCSGTAGGDDISGSDGADNISGRGGGDTIYAEGGEDGVYGGDGDDTLKGGYGNDTVAGNAGDDQIWGEEGNDLLIGGAGNDGIDAEDGSVDTIDCGKGRRDTVYFDQGVDVVNKNCEKRVPR